MAQRDLVEAGASGAPGAPTISPPKLVLARAIGAGLAAVLRLVDLCWRKDLEQLRELDRLIATGRPLITVFWHGKYLPLFSSLAGRKAVAFTAQSFRGSVVAEICRRFGYDAVPLPRNGGQRSRGLIREALSTRQIGAFAVDGPLGPYHVIKPGAIEFASERGAWLLPITVAARRRKIFADRWDKMEVPYPFTRLVLAIGEPIEAPASLSAEEMADMKERLRRSLEELDRSAEARANHRDGG